MLLAATLLAGTLGLAACGKKGGAKGQAAEGDSMTTSQMLADGIVAKPEWIRQEPIDLARIDGNRDGHVWQCPADANVIADEAGACPNCSRKLERVELDKARERLKDQQFESR